MSWYRQYLCAGGLSEDQKIFLSYYTEQEFTSLIPTELWINKPTKTTVKEACGIVQNWINTGVWEYDEIVTTIKKRVVAPEHQE